MHSIIGISVTPLQSSIAVMVSVGKKVGVRVWLETGVGLDVIWVRARDRMGLDGEADGGTGAMNGSAVDVDGRGAII